MPDNILRPDPGTNDERLYPAGYTPPIGDSAVISGGGTLTASGTREVYGSATLSGGGTLTASGWSNEVYGSVTLSGGGTLTASGTQGAPGVSSLNGTLKAYISEINDIFIGNINKINSV